MTDEFVKRSAQEYLAGQFAEGGASYEARMNREAAIALAPVVWRDLVRTVTESCDAWNSVTKEATLVCKETMLGDLRVRCSGRAQQLVFHLDSPRLLVRVENTARLEHEPKVVLSIEGYPAESGRSARLVRNNEPVNVQMLVLEHLRVLAGLSRKII